MNPYRPRVLGAAFGLALALASRAAWAAEEAEGPLFGPTSPHFAADVSAALEPDGRTALQVEIQVAYTEFQFVRVPAGFGAALEFVIVIRDRKNQQVAGDAWEERFAVATFAETRNPGTRIATTRVFRVPPGKYRLKVQIKDANGGLASEGERELLIAGLGKATLGLGDLVFGNCGTDSTEKATIFERNASRRYAEDLESFCVRSSVVDLQPPGPGRRYRMHSRIKDDTGKELWASDTSLTPTGAGAFVIRPDVSGLFLGSYRLELEVSEGRRKWATSGGFEIEAVTVPRGPQWSMILEILEYVATTTELDPLRKAKDDESRARAWKDFWARRDPTPDTPRNETLLEFMRRVRYANAQFQGLGPGWRSDQGRVYIRYGAPDQIEDIPASHSNYPTQIWHYFSINRRFVFADRDGFGHYDLVQELGP